MPHWFRQAVESGQTWLGCSADLQALLFCTVMEFGIFLGWQLLCLALGSNSRSRDLTHWVVVMPYCPFSNLQHVQAPKAH